MQYHARISCQIRQKATATVPIIIILMFDSKENAEARLRLADARTFDCRGKD
jgi:hypothetical protein